MMNKSSLRAFKFDFNFHIYKEGCPEGIVAPFIYTSINISTLQRVNLENLVSVYSGDILVEEAACWVARREEAMLRKTDTKTKNIRSKLKESLKT